MKKVIDFPDGSTIGQQAAEWLIRLDGDEALSTDERQNLSEWLARSPAHREHLDRLAELWIDMDVLTDLAIPLEGRVPESRPARFRPSWLVAAAASVFVAIGLAVFLAGDTSSDANGLYATAVGQQRLIELPDRSSVNLNTDSQIRVNYGPAYRDVYLLLGEAHFFVAENAEKPFRVFAGDGRIRALGTAFSVYMRDGAVDVTVTEGIVALERVDRTQATGEGSGMSAAAGIELQIRELGSLRAGQGATILTSAGDPDQIARLSNLESIEPREMQRRMAWTEGVLIFSGEPLEEVARQIGRYTTAEIEFADPEVGAIRIGGRFPVGATETMFETLEDSFGLNVTYTADDRVLISAGDRRRQ